MSYLTKKFAKQWVKTYLYVTRKEAEFVAPIFTDYTQLRYDLTRENIYEEVDTPVGVFRADDYFRDQVRQEGIAGLTRKVARLKRDPRLLVFELYDIQHYFE